MSGHIDASDRQDAAKLSDVFRLHLDEKHALAGGEVVWFPRFPEFCSFSSGDRYPACWR